MDAGIYVHVPFCVRKCHYCSFNSVPYSKNIAEEYLHALLAEIERFEQDVRPVSLYIGGGTPTVLPQDVLLRLIRAVYAKFSIKEGTEATLEANPGTLDNMDLAELGDAGINRVSLGVQSFDPAELSMLGRLHGRGEVDKSVDRCRSAGIGNVSLDLIYSLPGQDPGKWSESLRHAVSLSPEHISLYDLSVEAGTKLHAEVKAGRLALPPETKSAEMYLHAVEFLEERGFRRYEISNFARPGYECRHNLGYWSSGEYAGFGAGAHSHIGGRRIMNVEDVRGYVGAVKSGGPAAASAEVIGGAEREREFVMLALRKADGFSLEEYETRFGTSFLGRRGGAAERLAGAGYITLEGGRVRLTLSGVLASNAVICEFF
ncbi:MAG TPA: radical SAM family heme chaperone HemW [Nitrospirota bacterium]|nr:radical SAM family heme chaperone HemW [Nitrospirota bacterium]